MEPAATTSASAVPGVKRESLELRTQRLAAARRRATALLAAVTALFVAVTAAGVHGTFLGYVQAGAEAGMVGGVAGGGGGGCRRLVRGDGFVPSAGGPADTAHRADRRAQGSVRRHARSVC